MCGGACVGVRQSGGMRRELVGKATRVGELVSGRVRRSGGRRREIVGTRHFWRE